MLWTLAVHMSLNTSGVHEFIIIVLFKMYTVQCTSIYLFTIIIRL